MNEFLNNKKIYYGVINPKPEKTGKNTTYLTEDQIGGVLEHLPNTPLHIAHFTKRGREGGETKEVGAAGQVVEAVQHPKTGELWASFVLYDTHNGKVAKTLLEDLGENNIGELSLGQTFLKDEDTLEVVANKIDELSICWKGARDNTTIRGAKTIGEYFGIKENKTVSEIQNKKEDLKVDYENRYEQNTHIEEKEAIDLFSGILKNMDDIKNSSGPTQRDLAQIGFANPAVLNSLDSYDKNLAKRTLSINPTAASAQPAPPQQQQNQAPLPPQTNVAPPSTVAPPELPAALANKRSREEIEEEQRNIQKNAQEIASRIVPLSGSSNMQVDQTPKPNQQPHSTLPSNFSELPEETQKHLLMVEEQHKKLLEQNKIFQEKQERERIRESHVLKEKLNKATPFIAKILETEKDGEKTAAQKEAMTNFLSSLVQNPGSSGKHLTEFLSVAGKAFDDLDGIRARDAKQIEEAHQQQLQMSDRLNSLAAENKKLQQQLENSKVAFQSREERFSQVESAAAANPNKRHNDGNGGFNGMLKEVEQKMDKYENICYRAHKAVDRMQGHNTPDHILQQRAKILASDEKKFRLPDGELLEYNQLGYFPNENPQQYEWPSPQIAHKYGY